MTMSDAADLAWALADVVATSLRGAHRTQLYAKIGACDNFGAIADALQHLVDSHRALPPDLLQRVLEWLIGYADTDEEKLVVDLISHLVLDHARARPYHDHPVVVALLHERLQRFGVRPHRSSA